jgi:hypothetical protein
MLFRQHYKQSSVPEKRNFEKVMKVGRTYFTIWKQYPQIQNRSTTISVFNVLLRIVDGKSWRVSFVCSQITSFLTPHIYY